MITPMPVDQEIQELFQTEIAEKRQDLVLSCPDRLLSIHQSGDQITRIHHAYNPQTSAFAPELGVFRERTLLSVHLNTDNPVQGTIIQYDESNIIFRSDRYLNIKIGQTEQSQNAPREVYFSYYMTLKQRGFLFDFDENGNLVEFTYIKIGDGLAYYSHDIDKTNLNEINRLTPVEIRDAKYRFVLEPTPDLLVVRRYQKMKLLDGIIVKKPKVSSTRILEDIIPPELLEDPLSDNPKLDFWRTQDLLPVIVTELEQYPEE